MARDRPHERRHPRRRAATASASARRSAGPSSTGRSRTRTSASWPPAPGSACRSPSTSASATTSSTSIPTATAPPWAQTSYQRLPRLHRRRSRSWRAACCSTSAPRSWGRRSISRRWRWPATSPTRRAASIRNFTTAVFDLIPLDGDTRQQAPKTDPRYYYRPWKTILVRTVADGGESFYVQGDHRATVPHLHRAALAAERGSRMRPGDPLTDDVVEHDPAAAARADGRRARRPVPRPLPRHRRRPDRAVDRDRPGRLSGGARPLLSRRGRHRHQQPGGARRRADLCRSP